ncbi:hypothetical protein, partial [Vibrio parahaemolyticus]|uniref:hypothetical protein n=1 Tax=Vibrio parahaemolyticus TaxID=670 RepID=UPI001E5F6627
QRAHTIRCQKQQHKRKSEQTEPIAQVFACENFAKNVRPIQRVFACENFLTELLLIQLSKVTELPARKRQVYTVA